MKFALQTRQDKKRPVCIFQHLIRFIYVKMETEASETELVGFCVKVVLMR